MTAATTSKLMFKQCKRDDATQSTLQESDMSITDLVDDDLQRPSESHKTVEHQSKSLLEASTLECPPPSIEMGDLSVLSNLSMDTTLEKVGGPASSLDCSDLSLSDELTELLVSLAIKEQDNIVYYVAVGMCVSKYFFMLDMVLAAFIVVYIQREKSIALDRFLLRLQQELYDAVLDSIPAIPFLPNNTIGASTKQTSSLEERLEELAAENKELKSQLESEQSQVKSLEQSLSRKETILESEVINRSTFEQSSEVLQSIHDHEKTQLEETVKRLEDELASQKQATELMERQAVQRDELLANILRNFERSEATLFEQKRSRRRRSERGPAIDNDPALNDTDLTGTAKKLTDSSSPSWSPSPVCSRHTFNSSFISSFQ